MRRWLSLKKTSLREKFEGKEDSEVEITAALDEIHRKLISKAEFLVMLQKPSSSYKSEDPEAPTFMKKSSYMPKENS